MRERSAVSPHAHVAVPTATSGTADAGGWVGQYLRKAMALDAAVALAAGLIALRGRYDAHGHAPAAYIVLTVSLPVIWVGTLALAGAFLIFLRISPDWQIGAQGAILIVVLAMRALVTYGERRS